MKDDRVYLAHILECIAKIESYTSGGEGAFAHSELIRDAVIRNLEIIGEAAKRVSPEYRQAHPKIPWKTMAGMRDVLIHGYEGVNIARVWGVVQHDMPALKESIGQLIPSLEELEAEIAREADANGE